jgi:hypothetical protein
VETRGGGLRYLCADHEFHLFRSTGLASGSSTEIRFEVADLAAVISELPAA